MRDRRKIIVDMLDLLWETDKDSVLYWVIKKGASMPDAGGEE